MIDEPKQELLVQYFLDEVDPSTAEKIRAELETDAELLEFVRQTEDAFLNGFFNWNAMSQESLHLLPSQTSSG